REATFAEIASARKPIASDSPSAITPRITGRRQIRCRRIGELTSVTTSSIPPSAVRIATAQHDGPRIITPSSTACPPYVTLMRERHRGGTAPQALFAGGAFSRRRQK